MSEDVSGRMIRFQTTNAALPVADRAVVAPEDARTLRDQQELAGSRVFDRLRHRGDHVARQVRLDARHQGTCDHCSGHDLVWRSRQDQVAGITGFRGTTFQESPFLVLPVLYGGRVGRLGRRRGRPSRQRVERRIGGEARSGGDLRLRHRRGLLRTRAEEHRRGRGRFGLFAQRVVRVVAGGRVGGRHRLLRSHDGRAKIARQWRPQLWHGRRQLGVVRRQPVQSFRLRHAIHVVKLGLLVGPAPLRLQRPHQRTEHGDRQAAGEDGQRASVQSRDWARLGAQRHRLGRHLRRLRGKGRGIVWLMVSSSAPRHRCARSAPRRRHRHPGAVRPRRTADPRCSTASGNGSSPVARRPARR